ncbi:MAG TPA: arginase family protein, partial [Gaiellaceae bacterium]|nr:arginase family protein [Gaiellaceae bacterium]
CRTLTAVAIGPDYQCHACGREFAAGLLRVPRAWGGGGGSGGEAMAEAAAMNLPWPEAAIVAEETLEAQIDAITRELPARPLVLGGCCCSHVGAVRELARRHGRLGVVWIDAHGDLNTPESSPSGNAWGMPLRMVIDAGDVAAEDVTLLGARNLDPPEEAFIASAGIRRELGELPDTVYVALDCDVIEPGELDVWMPEPGGMPLDELEALLAGIPRPIGAGFSGLRASARNEEALARLGHALGL